MTTDTDPSIDLDRPTQKAPTRPERVRSWSRHLALGAATLAAVALVVGTVGPPLFGRGVFLATDLVYKAAPWQANAAEVGANPTPHGQVSDTLDAMYPDRATFGEALRDGNFAGWTSDVAGGRSLGAANSNGVLSVLALPYVLLPSWYAPGVTKALVMATAIGFTYLFCRRLGTRRGSAVLAGMAYAGSGFMVMWTNWVHVETAAFVPAVFWATERYLQRRTATSLVPVALTTAAMMAGGFPAVAGYGLAVLGPYVVIRVLAEHRQREPGRRRDDPGQEIRASTGPHGGDRARSLLPLAGVGIGIVTGVALTAWFLFPFAARLSSVDLAYRAQGADDHMGVPSLLTTVAPEAFGLTSNEVGRYLGPGDVQIDAVSFVGVVTVLLAALGLGLPRARRLPPGVTWSLAGTAAVLGIATYAGGPVLQLLQQVWLFSNNYIGRARSVLGLVLAVLAAIGFDAVLEHTKPLRRNERIRLAAVLAGTAALGGLVMWRSIRWMRSRDAIDVLRDGLVVPAVVAVLAVGALGIIWFGARHRRLTVLRPAATVALPILLAVESLLLAVPLLPNESRDTLYPETPATAFLRENLGDGRVALEGLGYYANGVMLSDIRSLTGHSFYAPTWRQMLLAADTEVFASSDTLATLHAGPDVMSSPLLDRMGVTWFAATPAASVPGRREDVGLAAGSCRADGGAQALRPDGEAATLTVPAGAGLRGVTLRVCEPAALAADAALVVEAGDGTATATGRLAVGPNLPAGEVTLALPGEELASDVPATLDIRLEGAGGTVLVAGTGDRVAADVIRPSDDGLRLAYADDLLIYQRTRALPRIRWAAHTEVIADEDERIERLGSGELPSDTVVLGTDPGEEPSRRSTEPVEPSVDVIVDSDERIDVDVVADRDGYLLVADALQNDWSVTVDGAPAELVDADHAGVAVAVPEGRHDVTFRFTPRRQRLGIAVSVVTAVGLVAVVLRAAIVRRRRRAT